jgi:predicted nucleic acid-binding protein
VIVVADSSPLRYLVLIQQIDILPALYGRVIVPPAVIAELTHEHTPGSVRAWLSAPPEWLEVRPPMTLPTTEPSTLGPGEQAAISLAEELSADALLIDDRDGRREAARRRLPVLGTLRVLADAAERGLLDLGEAFDRLTRTNFRAEEQLVRRLLAADAARRTKTPPDQLG